MGALQPFHLVVILIVVLMIFGLGRLPTVGSAVAKGIKDFRANVGSGGDPASDGSRAWFCPSCGTGIAEQVGGFCPRCGARLTA
jgi:sec-independent protein translocase protein TatA